MKEWRKKRMAEKTWVTFLKVLLGKYHNLVEETKVITREAGFHSTNSMQEIGGALEHLAIAAGANR